MQSSPTTSGEHDVQNLGVASEIVLRHNSSPLAASWQERTPRTPSVTTFPWATVGEVGAAGEVGKARTCS